MPSPSCPSSVIDQSHPQSGSPHDIPLLGHTAGQDSEQEEEEEEAEQEEEQEEEEYETRLYSSVTHGKGMLFASSANF